MNRAAKSQTIAASRSLRANPLQGDFHIGDRFKRQPLVVLHSSTFPLSHWMVTTRWAVAFRRYSVDYVADEDDARRSRINIWSGAFPRASI